MTFQVEYSSVFGLYDLLILYSCIDHIHFEVHLKNGAMYNLWYLYVIFPKAFGFIWCGKLLPYSVIKLFLHLSPSWAISSIGSSQFKFCLHSIWIICLPFSKKGAPKPRGSYILLRAARRPRHVAVLLFILIMNPRVSSLTFHFTSRALLSVKLPSFRSLSFIPSSLRSFVITLIRSTLLLVNFLHLLCTVLSLCSPCHQLSWHLESF